MQQQALSNAPSTVMMREIDDLSSSWSQKGNPVKLSHLIEKDEAGLTARQVLQTRLGCSGLLIKHIRLTGRLLLEGKPARMIDPVEAGQALVAEWSDAADELLEIEGTADCPLLGRDEHFVVVAKPPYLVTHPTYLHQANSLTQRVGEGLLRPCMRLDRDTSGLVLLARSGYAHHRLTQTGFGKRYLAWVHGVVEPDEGLLTGPIARAADSIMLREVSECGQPASSRFRVLTRWKKARVSLLEYELLTGRTHQLRVHSLYAGWPLLGETLYGAGRFEKDWPLRRPYQLPDPLRVPEPSACLSESANDLGKGHRYQGPYNLAKARYGDLAALKPVNWDPQRALHWDQVISRQALHAHRLDFVHPWTGEPNRFICPIPRDLQALTLALEAYENEGQPLAHHEEADKADVPTP